MPVSRRHGERWAEQDQQQASEEAPAAYTVPEQATSPEDPGDGMGAKLAQLKQLGELKAAGVLTEDEFQAQKSQILDA